MIAYETGGSRFALTEGSELLMHDGPSEGPLWRITLDDTIVGLGIDAEQIVAVTAAGTVSWFGAAAKADVRRMTKLDGTVRAACVDIANDRIVAITDRGVVRHTTTTEVIADDTATCIALSPDGTTLFATASELVTIALDGARKIAPRPAARALVYHPGAKVWLVGLESSVVKWDGTSELVHVTNLPAGSKLEHLAASARAIAIAWDRHKVVALAWPSLDTLGSLAYIEREVLGLAFGPWPWLGVGLDLGDGNKFNLETVAVNRSDTHPGREHHRWMLSVSGGAKPAAPAAPSAAPGATRAGGGGLPIAGIAIVAAIIIAIVFALR